ncbi:hypothetical protein TNCV_4443791 [Trichonephila clavipes]|nr:hypothetical protein TNCV_4443791 [Trichonephila clavipes]
MEEVSVPVGKMTHVQKDEEEKAPANRRASGYFSTYHNGSQTCSDNGMNTGTLTYVVSPAVVFSLQKIMFCRRSSLPSMNLKYEIVATPEDMPMVTRLATSLVTNDLAQEPSWSLWNRPFRKFS